MHWFSHPKPPALLDTATLGWNNQNKENLQNFILKLYFNSQFKSWSRLESKKCHFLFCFIFFKGKLLSLKFYAGFCFVLQSYCKGRFFLNLMLQDSSTLKNWTLDPPCRWVMPSLATHNLLWGFKGQILNFCILEPIVFTINLYS